MNPNETSAGTSGIKRPVRRTRRLAAVLLSAMALILIAGGICASMILRPCQPSAGHPRLIIPAGATEAQVLDSLDAALDGGGGTAYALWRVFKGTPQRSHGSYEVPQGVSLLKFARAVAHGNQTPVTVTFNNIRTIDELADRLAARVEAPKDSILAAMDRVLPERGYKPAEYPAAFLPDTYSFYWTVSPDKLVSTLEGYRGRFWSDSRRAKAKSLGLTPVQVSTLASIVEEETVNRAEHPTIARLYMNRLAKQMPLQACPTVKFALGDFGLRRITKDHLAVESPYNTYKVQGLPPGPIRIPDARTLDAVLDAPANTYLYMCAKADGSGTHAFATDYAAHAANARLYQAWLNKRGIR